MNLVNLLNTIRDNASSVYKDTIPEATRTNIESIQAVMTDPTQGVVQNEFVSALLNMIILQVIHDKSFKDPLAELKKGNKPLGDTVEEIYANYVQAKGYDPAGTDLLTRELPDVKAIYHKMNRKDKYAVNINQDMLGKAFASYDKLESMISSLINTLSKSAERDEFTLIKQLFAQAYESGALTEIAVPDPTVNETNAKAFTKAVKIVSGDMQFPSARYNGWLRVQSTDIKPIVTNSTRDEQILIVSNATDVSLDVDYLAGIFNLEKGEFNNTRKIVIDEFPVPGMVACLVDREFFQVFDDLMRFSEFFNADNLETKYYLHVWQTLSYSSLVNAVCFMASSDSDNDGSVEEFTVTYTLASGTSSSNKRTKVLEGSKYTTTISGATAVAVTMGGETVSGAYNSTTKKVTINEVTGNIVITATKS